MNDDWFISIQKKKIILFQFQILPFHLNHTQMDEVIQIG